MERKIVEYIGELAKIYLNEEEKVFLGEQLSKIISYISKLQELNVEDIEPMRGALFEENVFREDLVEQSGCWQDILNNAPLTENNFFKIPPVIEV